MVIYAEKTRHWWQLGTLVGYGVVIGIAVWVAFSLSGPIARVLGKTGTGKTLAYLLPAVELGRRVVVSTATKALQEQIFTKDLNGAQVILATRI